MLELQGLLADAQEIEDVATIALELLYQSRGDSITAGRGVDAMTYDLWRQYSNVRQPPVGHTSQSIRRRAGTPSARPFSSCGVESLGILPCSPEATKPG